MLSPCVKLCQLDEPRGRCIGCGRTVLEIAAWTAFTDEERHLIMKRLRQQGFGTRGAPPVPEPSEHVPESHIPQAAIHEIEVQPPSRRHPASVRIDGIVYGAPVLALVEAMQDIAAGNLDAEQCRNLARRVLNQPE